MANVWLLAAVMISLAGCTNIVRVEQQPPVMIYALDVIDPAPGSPLEASAVR